LGKKPFTTTDEINTVAYWRERGLERQTSFPVWRHIFNLGARSEQKARRVCWYVPAYFEDSDDVWRELHESRVGHPPVDPIHEDAGSDSVCNRPELGLLVRLPPSSGQLPGEGGGEPFSHLGWHSVRLHLRQLVVVVR
jgi:hypothetical protein